MRHTLTCRAESDQEERYTQYAEQTDRVLVALCLVHYAVVTDRTEPLHEVERCTGYDELTDVRCNEAVGVQSGTLVRIVGHHGRERTVRQVDKRIRRTQQQTGDQGVGELTVQAELRRSECQYGKDSVRHGAEEQVRTELTPTRGRTVGYDTYHGIHYRIPYTAYEHDHTGQCGREAVDVGVEDQ